MGRDEGWYGEAQLERVPDRDLPRWQSRDELLRDLLLAKLSHPLTDSLYAYRASRTDYEPYQFRPALKFLRQQSPGLLIADEVGLGKTIEAAIIYLELKARLGISRVLVLCPSRLTKKWQDELRNRFEEEFTILDATKVRQLLDDDLRLGPSFPIRAIASFELLRREEFITRFEEQNIPLDLLIVDEAHHMRNAEANTHRLGNVLVNLSDAILFLTATPLHLGNQDLYNLLNMLAPDEFDNPQLFEEQVRPNRHVNRAIQLVAAGDLLGAHLELCRVEKTLLRERFLQNPYYNDVKRKLASANDSLDLPERIALQRELVNLNTLSNVFTRTRKREVAHAAERAAFTLKVTLSPAERAFYDGVLQLARHELHAARPGATGFAAIMKERQAASCLAALREIIEKSARSRHAAMLQVEHSSFDVHAADETPKVTSTNELVRLSREIGDQDSKFDLFRATLDQSLAESPTSKALVFSFFKGTLEYLRRRLERTGYRVGMIHGDVKIEERRRIIEEFRSDPKFRVLLSSEVGAEGLDFQFCDILVNYDLPWNPMQVEQRIGRLDRFGQTHPRIRIYNFCIEDTIETRIFQRLYDRIAIFKHSIGDLEAILGEEISELSRKVLQGTLTPEEEERLAVEVAERIIRRQQDEEALERHREELLGQGSIIDQQIEATVKSGRVISAEEVRALVFTYLKTQFPRAGLVGDDKEPCWTLDLDIDLANHLRQFIESKRLHNRVSSDLWRAMTQHGRIRLTFDNVIARQRPNLEFVTVHHPLAEAAREFWKSHALNGTPATSIIVEGRPEEVGDGYFFIYILDVRGVAPKVLLEPIIVRDDGSIAVSGSEHLLRQLQEYEGSSAELTYNDTAFASAERIAAAHVATLRDELEQEARLRNEALLAQRQASVSASFDAKIRRTRELLDQATNERIRRMRTAQIHNLEARKVHKLEELQRAREVIVSSALIAGGRVRIVSSKAARERIEPFGVLGDAHPIERSVDRDPRLARRSPTDSTRDSALSAHDNASVEAAPSTRSGGQRQIKRRRSARLTKSRIYKGKSEVTPDKVSGPTKERRSLLRRILDYLR